MNLDLLISKTANGKMQYLQIISEDQVTVNIVLIAEEVRIQDKR